MNNLFDLLCESKEETQVMSQNLFCNAIVSFGIAMNLLMISIEMVIQSKVNQH